MLPCVTRRAIPELFLGLLAIGLAAVWGAHICAGTIHDARHTKDTLSITGSGRKPISSHLASCSLHVRGVAKPPEAAARAMRRGALRGHACPRRGAIPTEAISDAVVEAETLVTPLPKHRRF